MKLTVFFLLCSVSLSYQQYYYPSRSYYDPRMSFLYPRNAQTFLDSLDFYQGRNNYYNSPLYAQEDLNAQGRKSILAPERKFFGGLTINLPPSKPATPSVTITKTVFSSTVSTLQIAQFKSCIGSLQFVTNAAVPAVTSTAPCSRRRRQVAVTVDALVEATPVLQLETSVAPVEIPINKRSYYDIHSSNVESSQLFPKEPTFRHWSSNGWNWNNWETVVTVTSISTSFVFQTTTVTKSFTLASSLAPGPGLLCLPLGYNVC